MVSLHPTALQERGGDFRLRLACVCLPFEVIVNVKYPFSQLLIFHFMMITNHEESKFSAQSFLEMYSELMYISSANIMSYKI